MARVALFGWLLAAAALGAPGPRLANAPKPMVADKVKDRFQPAEMDRQRIRGILGERIRVNIEARLLRVDPAVLLAGFRNRPGSHLTIGEHAGQFLEAAANSWAYTGDPRLKTLMDRVAQDLVAAQLPDGYLGTYPEGLHWTNADVWVNGQVLAGLLAYYSVTGDQPSLAAARKIGDLLEATFGDGKRDILRSGAYGGLASIAILGPVTALYRYTGEQRHLEFARYLARAGGSVLRTSGTKAYETMLSLAGLVDFYRLIGEDTFLKPAVAAWKDIAANRLYLTGTTSAGGYFQADGVLPGEESAEAGDCCATVAWLELSGQLLRLTGEPAYAEEIERTVFNALLGAQDAKSGNFSEYLPMVGRKRPSAALSCALSNGPRGIAMLPQFVWGLHADGPAVFLYAPGEANISVRPGFDVALRAETRMPAAGSVTLTVRPPRVARFPLYLRVPSWCTRFTATASGAVFSGKPGELLKIDRVWQPGDVVQIEMDLPVRIVPGGKSYADYVAVVRGPQVLALETSLNRTVPYPHRAAPKSLDPANLGFAEASAGPLWPQAYTIEGMRARQSQPLTLVPFSSALHYRLWLARPDRLSIGPVAVTAFGHESWSRAGTELGSICDERSDTYRNTFQGRPLKLDWYAVEIGQPAEISRVVYRHGKLFSNGGWFDTSEGKPKIQIKRTSKSDWETVATLDTYPDTTAAEPPALRDGDAFSIRLPAPVKAVGVRITGKPGQSFSSCAELGGYEK